MVVGALFIIPLLSILPDFIIWSTRRKAFDCFAVLEDFRAMTFIRGKTPPVPRPSDEVRPPLTDHPHPALDQVSILSSRVGVERDLGSFLQEELAEHQLLVVRDRGSQYPRWSLNGLRLGLACSYPRH
jgi:hypothetical protein